MNIFKLSLAIILTIISFQIAFAQDHTKLIEQKLNELSTSVKGLNEKVQLSVTDLTLQEFVRGIAVAHKLNVSIDPNIHVNLYNNFADAIVKDVLIFLCRKHKLNIDFIGSIMSVTKYIEPIKPPEPIATKLINVRYNNQNDFLSLDLKNDTLGAVVRQITKLTLKNVILTAGLENEIVSVYIQNRPFNNTIEKMAFANGLTSRVTEDNFIIIEKIDQVVGNATQNSSNRRNSRNNLANRKNRRGNANSNNKSNNEESFLVLSSNEGRINVHAKNISYSDLINDVSDELGVNYFMFNEPEGNATMFIENASYEEFLTYLLNGSTYTYKKEGKIYLVGERSLERLRNTVLVRLENRTVESIVEYIPTELKKDIDIKEFIELNGLVLSGSQPKIIELKEFITVVDQIVPVIMIDILIVDAKTNRSLETGISAGWGTPPPSANTLSPGIDLQFNSSAVNKMINSFNGFGFLNLGKVTNSFYLSIKALEAEGMIKLRSTPQLATLNGHEADMSIGETEYYLEVQNNVVGNQLTQNVITQTQQYKPINADLAIKIKPTVSGNDHITLDISLTQSSFTNKISESAPRGSVTRKFNSLIRVKDGEMILLGGLEEKNVTNSGSGIPLLSRIPIIKWFFSSRSYTKEKSKLSIFIRPTIIY